MQSLARRSILFAFCIGVLSGCSATPDVDFVESELENTSAAWPEDRRSPRRTGYNPYETEITLATAPALAAIWQAPATGGHLAFGNGALMVSSDEPSALLALQAENGAVLWSRPGNYVGPSAATKNALAVATSTPSIAILNASSGELVREVHVAPLSDPRVAAPLSSRGDFVFESDFGFEECIAQDLGEVCYPRRSTAHISSQTASGASHFEFDAGFGLGVPALADGRVFAIGSDLSSYASSLAAFSAVDGTSLWQTEYVLGSGPAPQHPPAVLHGRVFALMGADWLFAYDERSGRVLWQRQTGFTVSSLIASDTAVFVAAVGDTGSVRIQALDSASGALLREAEIPGTLVGGEFVATRDLLLGGIDDELVVLHKPRWKSSCAFHSAES